MQLPERRDIKPAVPADLNQHLTTEQIRLYHYMQGFGWRMYFVRRPLFQHPTVVMISDDGTKVGLLEEEGHLDMHPTTLKLRN